MDSCHETKVPLPVQVNTGLSLVNIINTGLSLVCQSAGGRARDPAACDPESAPDPRPLPRPEPRLVARPAASPVPATSWPRPPIITDQSGL